VAARELADTILARFSDPDGGFFDTADDHEALITRPKGLQDNALPSGGAMASHVLLRLAALTGDSRYREPAERALAQVVPIAPRYPTAFAQWLNAFALATGDVVEIAIVGAPNSPEAASLITEARRGYRPLSVIAAGPSESSAVPLLHDRPMRDGVATAYVCRGFACRAPVTEPADLAEQLASGA
jgi:uncharacterized protein YyaL (SSP411 family)